MTAIFEGAGWHFDRIEHLAQARTVQALWASGSDSLASLRNLILPAICQAPPESREPLMAQLVQFLAESGAPQHAKRAITDYLDALPAEAAQRTRMHAVCGRWQPLA